MPGEILGGPARGVHVHCHDHSLQGLTINTLLGALKEARYLYYITAAEI
jgi:hypothetical protein